MTHLSWGATLLALTLGLGGDLPCEGPATTESTPLRKCCCETQPADPPTFCCEDVCWPERYGTPQTGDLMIKYLLLFKEGRYAEAEEIAARASALDPDDAMATAAASTARALRRIKEFKVSKDENQPCDLPCSYFNGNNACGVVREKVSKHEDQPCTMPCSNLVANNTTSVEKEIVRRLEAPISLEYKAVPLSEVVDDLRDRIGVNIILDRRALDEDGISTCKEVSIKLEGVSAKAALKLLLEPMCLTYVIKDEVLQITTETHARGKVMTRTYPVKDILIPNRPIGFLRQEKDGKVPIIHLIANTICPQTWSEVGGPGTMGFHRIGQALVVNQTSDVHEKIKELLTKLRAIQVQQRCCPYNYLRLLAQVAPPMMPPPGVYLPSAGYPPQFNLPCPQLINPPPAPVPAHQGPTVCQSGPPACPPSPLPPAQACPVPQPPPMLQSPVCPAEPEVQMLRIAAEGGQIRLALLGVGDACVTCPDLTMKIPGGPLKVSVVNNQLQVSAGAMRAVADNVTRGPNDRIILEGHVKLRIAKDGQQVAVSADRVVIGLTSGYLEIKGTGTRTPTLPTPVTPVRQEAPVGSTPEQNFSFWSNYIWW